MNKGVALVGLAIWLGLILSAAATEREQTPPHYVCWRVDEGQFKGIGPTHAIDSFKHPSVAEPVFCRIVPTREGGDG